MQENKSECFFLNTVYINYLHCSDHNLNFSCCLFHFNCDVYFFKVKVNITTTFRLQLGFF